MYSFPCFSVCACACVRISEEGELFRSLLKQFRYVVGSKSFRPDLWGDRNKTSSLFFNIVSLYFNTLSNWHINLTIDGTIYPSQHFPFGAAFIRQSGNFWTLLRTFGEHLCVCVRNETQIYPTHVSANVSPGHAATELSSGPYILTAGTCCLKIKAIEQGQRHVSSTLSILTEMQGTSLATSESCLRDQSNSSVRYIQTSPS